jgi:hypothetical protein
MYVRAPDFQSISVQNFMIHALGLPGDGLRRGIVGIWTRAILTDAAGKEYLWTCLDIEAPAELHDDLEACIEVAQEFWLMLREYGLIDDRMMIFLTGRGFRFSWPYIVSEEYKEAFLLWIKSTPAIDASPFLKRAHYRHLAYRGHRNQGKPRDTHIELLPKNIYIFDLDVVEYTRLVSGMPDVDSLYEWLPRLLPSMEMPQAWKDFLEPYRQQLKYKSLIYTPKFPGAKGITNWSLIYEDLARRGIQYREFSHGGGTFLRLHTCPFCARRDGNPYITPSGRAKCNHENSCDAAATRGGIPPHQWVDGYHRVTEPIAPVEYTDTIETAREKVAAAIRSGQDVVIVTPCGSGKTHSTIQALLEEIAKNPHMLVVCSAPRRDLAQKSYKLALQLSEGQIPIAYLEGRHGRTNKLIEGPGVDLSSDANCYKAREAEKMAKRGYSPRLTVCRSCPGIYEDTLCEYNEQFKNLPNSGIVFTTTEQAAISLIESLKPHIWVIDENPTKTFLKDKKLDQGSITAVRKLVSAQSQAAIDRMVKPAMDLQPMIENQYQHARLYATAVPANSPWSGAHQNLWDIAGITEAERAALQVDLSFFERLEGERIIEWTHRLLARDVDLVALKWFWTALGLRSQGIAYIKIKKSPKQPITFVYTENTMPDYQGRIVHLDATAYLPEVESLFCRPMQVVDAQVKMPGLKKTFLRYPIGNLKAKGMKPEDIKKHLRECFKHLRAEDQKVLIATHMVIEQQLLDLAKTLDSAREWDSCHFGGNRGENTYEDFDAVIVFGTMALPPEGILDDQMALYQDEELRQEHHRRKDIAELEQTIHRIRPIRGNRNVIVMGRYWPESFGEPDITLSLIRGKEGRKTEEAVERLAWALDVYGFVTPDMALGLGIGHKSDEELINTIVKSHDNNPLMHVLRQASPFSKILFKERGRLNLRQWEIGLSSYLSKPLIFDKPKYWDHIIKRLDKTNKYQPLYVKHDKRNWTQCLGTIEAAQQFYAAAQLEFLPEYWRQQSTTQEQATGTF